MTPIGQYDLPVMPELPGALIHEHDRAQEALHDAIQGLDPLSGRVFRYVQLRLLTEAAASLDPAWLEREPVVLPPRRRFVARPQQIRTDGVAAALRHVDARVAMTDMGVLDRAVGPETPMVLHAFVEAGDPQKRITNAGCVRATPLRFIEGDIPFVPPPAEHCRRLLDQAVEVANVAPAPYLTRACWLMAAVFAVHPFVDGNGRTGRLLMYGLMSENLPTRADWGTIPEFAARRQVYLDATRQPLWPSVPDYDARLMEPIHLVRFAAETAVAGARRTLDRLRHIESLVDAASPAGLEPDALVALLAIWADRNARLDELVALVPEPDLTVVVNDLVNAGLVAWSPWADLNPTTAAEAVLGAVTGSAGA